MGMTGTALSATPQNITWLSRGRPVARPYPIYPCADGYVRIVLLTGRQWRKMGDWLGTPPATRSTATSPRAIRSSRPSGQCSLA